MTQHILFISDLFAKPLTDIIHNITTGIQNFSEAKKARQKHRQTVRELTSLSDRDLLDMGISRYDIERIASETR